MRRSVLAAAVAATSVAALLVGIQQPADASGSVTLARGVVLGHSSFTFEGHPESVWTLTVDLSAHTQLVSTSPNRQIGHTRENLLQLAQQEKAVGGVNGDTLYFVDPTNQPRGGVMFQGRTLKSPLTDQQAVLYTTTANKANIGNVGFSGAFSSTNDYSRKNKRITSYNSLENAKNGGISLTDHSELTRSSMKTIGNADAQQHTPSCDQVTVQHVGPGKFKVLAFRRSVSSYRQVPAGDYSLFTCATTSDASDKKYVEDNLRLGQTFSARSGYAVQGLRSAISGVRKLIANGKAYNDPLGLNDLGPYLLPESFACIARGGTHVLLGTVDGREKQSAGMTYAMLTRYLLGRHCYAAMALSGSTDSQLVAKRPGSGLAFQNHLSDKVGTKPNGLVDGLLVVVK